MTTEPTTSRHNPMKVIFNYQNVFFNFFYDDADACVHRSREYAMNYVLSGEMVLDDGHRQIHVGKGECSIAEFTCASPVLSSGRCTESMPATRTR